MKKRSLSFTLLLAAALAIAPVCTATGEITTTSTTDRAATHAATTPVRISELVNHTVAQNPELRFYEKEIQLAQDRRAVAGRWADPELTVEIGRKSAREADGTYGGDGLAWGVTLAQKFDFSGRNALRKAIADRQIDRAEAGLLQFRRELAAKTAELAYTLLAAQQRLDAAEEVASRGRAMLKTLVQRDPAGVAALLETRVIEADILKLEKSAAAQRAELLAALAELNMLRGVDPETSLVLSNETSDFAPAPSNATLLATAIRDNYTLRQFELDLQEQGIAVNLERRNGYGDVTIAPYYTEERAGSTERTMGVGVTIPLPLWDANKAGVAEARTREGQAENALRKARRDLHKDVVSTVLAYRASQQLLAEWGAEKVTRFREAAELGERHYRLGTVPVSTYLSLQQAYLDSIETVTATRTDTVKAAAQLTILTGLSFESFLQARQPAVTPAKEEDHSGHNHPHPPAVPGNTTKSDPHAGHNHADEPHDGHDDHTGHNHDSHDHSQHDHAKHEHGNQSKAQPVAVGEKADEHSHEHDHDHDHEGEDDHSEKDEHAGHNHAHGNSPVVETARFDEKRGLSLTKETVSSMGLKTDSVEMRTISENIPVSAQVISTNPPRAAGIIPPSIARKLENATSDSARIQSLDASKVSADGTVDVTLALADGASSKNGEFITCYFRTKPSTPAASVPSSAILKTSEGTFVYQAIGEWYKRIPVTLGPSNNTYSAVTKGLKVEDTVVAEAVDQLWLTELRLTKGGGHTH
ncbi:MAG: TolC family protein [Puniceicoccales bacterium]|nr:TolC family protein [Puniceicoccales bacterium]